MERFHPTPPPTPHLLSPSSPSCRDWKMAHALLLRQQMVSDIVVGFVVGRLSVFMFSSKLSSTDGRPDDTSKIVTSKRMERRAFTPQWVALRRSAPIPPHQEKKVTPPEKNGSDRRKLILTSSWQTCQLQQVPTAMQNRKWYPFAKLMRRPLSVEGNTPHECHRAKHGPTPVAAFVAALNRGSFFFASTRTLKPQPNEISQRAKLKFEPPNRPNTPTEKTDRVRSGDYGDGKEGGLHIVTRHPYHTRVQVQYNTYITVSKQTDALKRACSNPLPSFQG